jgi:hypothetical protein
MTIEIDRSDYGMDFCSGMSMTMSMGGFQSALFSRSPADCITFLFTDWKLDQPGKFVSAMICTFVLAVMSEGITHGQAHVRNIHLARTPKGQQKVIMALLYGFQQLVGWTLMLISMTFSIELFASVVVGLLFGKMLFQANFPVRGNRIQRRSSDLDVAGADGDGDGDADNNLLFQEEEPSVTASSDGSSGSAVRRRRR